MPFLPQAIESALAQTYPDTEVIVVDDGSTDGSPDVIARYRGDIYSAVKANGGQASALNTAFAMSCGDIVCLLDADDVFHCEKVADTVSAFEGESDACLVYHQLQTVDGDGRPMHRPWPRQLHRGDIRRIVRRTGGYYPRPPTSGLAFRRDYVEPMFSIPTGPHFAEDDRDPGVAVELKPDTYLAAPAAFLGPVVGIERPLGYYRVHGGNKSGAAVTLERERDRSLWHRRLRQFAVEFRLLDEELQRRLGTREPISLEDHLEYEWLRTALGETTVLSALARTARCPALGWRARARESLRVALGRGWSGRIPDADERPSRLVSSPVVTGGGPG